MKKLLIIAMVAALVLVSCATAAVTETAPAEPEVVVPQNVIINSRTQIEYTNLPEAINAAMSGDEIVLYMDVTLSDSLTISKAITIDLNGHTINGASLVSQKDTGCLNLAGSKAERISRIVIKNGTVNGSYSGTTSAGGVIRGYYVSEIVLENLSVINKANDVADAHSDSVYVTYCHLTINNTNENTFQGKLMIYDNASVSDKDGGYPTEVAINGGVYKNDSNSADKEVIRFASKGKAVPTTVENAVFESGIITCSSLDTADSKFVVKAGTYCFDPTAYVDATAYTVSSNGTSWVVKAK